MTIDDQTNVDFERRVASFHIANPDLGDGYSFFSEMRDKCPIAHSERYGGFWVLTRYEDIHQSLKQPETFSSRDHGVPPIEGHRLIPLNYDPPEHGIYRNQFAPFMSPAVVASVEPRARARVRQLIQAFVEAGGGDFIAEVAVPFPCITFLELLGLPLADLDQLLKWKEIMVRDLHLPERVDDVLTNVRPKIYQYFEEKIVAREHEVEPPQDLVTAIVHAKHGNAPFTLEEKTATLDLFFEAGLDTVTGLLGFIVEFLATHPDHRRQLIEEPDLIPNAVEEFLRFFGTVTLYRTVMHDTNVGGSTLREGDDVVLLLQAAGRDPAMYSEPDTVDFHRENIRHLSLGGGPHRCIGSHLARVELRLALEELLAWMPAFSIAGDPATVTRHWGVVAGLESLPLVVTTD